MIELKNVDKVKNGRLKNINLTIPQGKIIGLYGVNGSGKSTLIKSILGFIPYNGEILLDGEPITRKNIHRLAYASCENSFFPELSMHQHCLLYTEQFENFNKNRCDALLEFFDLKKYIDRPLGRFSTGQKNQFETILALSQGADYIFLDEPFTGNDMFNREDFYKVLMGTLKDHETIVLCTHLLEETNNFIDHLILMKEGAILEEKSVEVIEATGYTVSEYVKRKYEYKEDRVYQALDQLNK